MNEQNFFTPGNENPGDQPDVLNDEPNLIEEYPNVGSYNREELIAAIRAARD